MSILINLPKKIIGSFIKLFSSIIRNRKATRLLKTRYYFTAQLIGLISVFAGLLIVLTVIYGIAPLLGITSDSILESEGLRNPMSLILHLVFFYVSFYIGMVVVAGSFAFINYKVGRFTKKEAVDFAFLATYPAFWYK